MCGLELLQLAFQRAFTIELVFTALLGLVTILLCFGFGAALIAGPYAKVTDSHDGSSDAGVTIVAGAATVPVAAR